MTRGDDKVEVRRGSAFPFVKIPHWVLLAPISDRALRVYAALAKHANNDTGVAFPSRKRIAEWAGGCSIRTVSRAVVELQAIGAIEVTMNPKSGSGYYAPNTYVVHELPPAERPSTVSTEASTGRDSSGNTPRANPGKGVLPDLAHELDLEELEPEELEGRPHLWTDKSGRSYVALPGASS